MRQFPVNRDIRITASCLCPHAQTFENYHSSWEHIWLSPLALRQKTVRVSYCVCGLILLMENHRQRDGCQEADKMSRLLSDIRHQKWGIDCDSCQWAITTYPWWVTEHHKSVKDKRCKVRFLCKFYERAICKGDTVTPTAHPELVKGKNGERDVYQELTDERW